MPLKKTISKREFQRKKAHDTIDFIFNEIERMRQTGDVQIRFDFNQGGVRGSSINFAINNFFSLKKIPG